MDPYYPLADPIGKIGEKRVLQPMVRNYTVLRRPHRMSYTTTSTLQFFLPGAMLLASRPSLGVVALPALLLGGHDCQFSGRGNGTGYRGHV